METAYIIGRIYFIITAITITITVNAIIIAVLLGNSWRCWKLILWKKIEVKGMAWKLLQVSIFICRFVTFIFMAFYLFLTCFLATNDGVKVSHRQQREFFDKNKTNISGLNILVCENICFPFDVVLWVDIGAVHQWPAVEVCLDIRDHLFISVYVFMHLGRRVWGSEYRSIVLQLTGGNALFHWCLFCLFGVYRYAKFSAN